MFEIHASGKYKNKFMYMCTSVPSAISLSLSLFLFFFSNTLRSINEYQSLPMLLISRLV